jgi:indolepyruvate ferredoxin oxidoreductase beta subunit
MRGQVISSVMFGALAGSGALPFPREAFEAAIRAGGKGVEANLTGFAAGFDAAQGKRDDRRGGPAESPRPSTEGSRLCRADRRVALPAPRARSRSKASAG